MRCCKVVSIEQLKAGGRFSLSLGGGLVAEKIITYNNRTNTFKVVHIGGLTEFMSPVVLINSVIGAGMFSGLLFHCKEEVYAK